MEKTALRLRLFRPRNVFLALLASGGVGYVLEHPAGVPAADPADPLPPVTAGFVAYHDPAGFTLQRPDGWRVMARSLSEISVASPTSGAVALIRARVVRGDLSRWLAQEFPAAEGGMAGHRMAGLSAEGPDVARATFQFRQDGMEKRTSVVVVRRGEIASIFSATAPAAGFAEALPALAQILDSFRFSREARGSDERRGGDQGLRFVQWVEPFEQAFSMDVPAGWQPKGGLLRRADGVRVAYEITAPDGATFLFGGDPSLPAYFVFPTEIAMSLGNREGQPTGGNGPIMLRFQDAASMAQTVIHRRFGPVQVTQVRQRADLIEILRRNPVLQGSVPRVSAAEVEFRLSDGRVGLLALTTQGQEVPGLGGTWYVDNIHGFIAPGDRAAQTGMALARAIGTARENPRWRSDEAAHQARMTAQYQEYAAYSANLQRQTLEARWASDATRQDGMRDILGGTVRLRDPVTGESFEASGQSRYYYRVVHGAGNTAVGTESDFNPAPALDMRRLLQAGVDLP